MPQTVALAETLEKTVPGAVVRLQQDDLTALPVDAVVYYAREDLVLGSGFGTAIQVRGGDSIKKELAAMGKIAVGQAVMTGAGNLKARHIIHVCGPKFQEDRTEEKLRDSMLAALRMAREAGLRSIAFPPMGAGFYGVPLDLCAGVMLDAIRSAAASGAAPPEIVVCVRDRHEFTAFRRKMEKL
jgi:O-acetyl-ADP-ribose deacetylase (regulator of RNase III)